MIITVATILAIASGWGVGLIGAAATLLVAILGLVWRTHTDVTKIGERLSAVETHIEHLLDHMREARPGSKRGGTGTAS